jgi:NADPH:quinone reductase-like Zn-dependent oxidoreductase
MAGVVEAVAPAVDAFRAGDAVFGDTTATHPWINGGAFAEYVAVDPGLLALKPDAVSFEQAAAVPTSGLITLQNLRGVDRWPPGRKVLINGAGGGVGSLALQIVKAYGAHVTAVDSAAKLDVLRDLGADRVMDYTQEDFARGGERYDLIFDVPGTRPFSSMKPALKPGGRYVPIGHEGFGAAGSTVFGLIPHFLAIMARSRFEKGLRGPDVPVPGKPEAIGALRAFLENGTIKPVIDSAFGLDEVRAAFRRMIGGETTGRVILVP